MSAAQSTFSSDSGLRWLRSRDSIVNWGLTLPALALMLVVYFTPLLRVLWISVIAATVIAVLIAVVGAAPVAVLVGSAAFGAAIAPQFPTMLAHLHRSVPLTGTVTSWCIAGAAVGGLILPPLIGGLFESVGAAALPWTIAAASVLSAGVLVATDRYALVFGSGTPAGADAATA